MQRTDLFVAGLAVRGAGGGFTTSTVAVRV